MNHFIQSKALLQVMDLWTISSLNSEERNIRYYDPRLNLLLSQAWIQYTTQEKREEKKEKKDTHFFYQDFVDVLFCAHGVLMEEKGEEKGKKKQKKRKKDTHFSYRDFMGVLFWLFCFYGVMFCLLPCFYGCPVLFFMGVLFCFCFVFLFCLVYGCPV